MKILNLFIMAEIEKPDGGTTFVDCRARERDIEPEVAVFLKERACGMHGDIEPLDPEFDRSDALGG